MKQCTRSALVVSGCLAVLLAPALAAPQAAPRRILSFEETLDGSEERELRWPAAVAAASAEEIAVADAFAPRLLRFRKLGVSWQLAGWVELPGAPIALAWDGTRYVASLRQGQDLVAIEDEDLLLRRLPLPRGVVPGPLAASPDGRLLVYDYAGARVVSPSDASLAVAIPGEVTALAAAAGGGFFVAVADEGSVVRIDATGKRTATWKLPSTDGVPAWPVGLAADTAGDVFVVDRHAGRLLVLDASGQVVGQGSRRGWEPGLLREPRGIARLDDGRLVVADQGNGRLQVFRKTD